MKVSLLITTYNRPQYLKRCLESVRRADLSALNQILIVDDASTDAETIKLLNFAKDRYEILSTRLNIGIRWSLQMGYQQLFERNDIVINLDGDALVRNDFVLQLLKYYQPGKLLTGFHSTTKNRNGTERHKIISTHDGYVIKQSVGGINMCIDRQAYENYVLPALQTAGNWDHNACINAGGAMCLVPSVVEHIGFDSSMGHNEPPDVAAEFKELHLPDVTLIGVDSNNERLTRAAEICTKDILFADVVLLHPNITSKEQYSEFCIKELHKHVHTSHALVFQHDGYVNNWQAWDNEWLKYDYIGATWWYNDGMNVGNGGFSLRSKKLLEAVKELPEYHPEDAVICRKYRKQLEAQGIVFAPDGVADRFSYEGYMQPHKKLDKQFGLHGALALRKESAKKVTGKKYVVSQYRGLGDVLFLIPMIRGLQQEGHEILWPIAPEYLNIAKHFPDIHFVDYTTVKIDYNRWDRHQTPYGEYLPYRWAIEIQRKTLHECMQAKYSLYGHDWRQWRNLTWQRDWRAEACLKSLLNLPEKYILVNRSFGEGGKFKSDIHVSSDLPVIEMQHLHDFSLIDWLGVIEDAAEVHVANSSITYLLELMQWDKPIHIYRRKIWGEQAFEYTSALWENKAFIYH